jgi:uncharacterized protein (TIGR00730 family)
MKRIAVFCGSSAGSDPAYVQAADALGALLVSQGIDLVYGGGNVGLMGRIADAVVNHGGEVIGVIPKFLMEKELGKVELPHLRVVASMHERKAMMADLADGFVALPGGFGTFEEFCEILTWGQLGLHVKPFGLLNVAGFYDHFLAFVEHAVHRQFIKPRHHALLLTSPDPEDLLAKMKAWHAEFTPRWMTPERT